MPSKKQKRKVPARNVGDYLEATLDCVIEDFEPRHNLSAKEAKKILRECPLDSVCGAFCRRTIDAAAGFADFVARTLDFEDDSDVSGDHVRVRDACIYTCVVTITG